MIYCVEDDDSIRDIEVYTLRSTGFDVCGFPDGTAFFEALEKERPELILLDVMLPGEDGIAILKQLKDSTSTKDIPVIMATAKGMAKRNATLGGAEKPQCSIPQTMAR